MKWRQLKKIRKRDVINPKKWASVFRAAVRESTVHYWQIELLLFAKLTDRVGYDLLLEVFPIQDHEVEQIMYRTITCGLCVDQGYCEVCGCSMPGKAMDPKTVCMSEEGSLNWGPVRPKEEWEEYKEMSMLHFEVLYNNKVEASGIDDKKEKWYAFKKASGLRFQIVNG